MPKTGTERPLIVIVSGAPGSGKTTLAHHLAAQMRLLHIPRDEFLRSLDYTAGAPIDKRKVGTPVYYEALVYLAQHGVSVVTDGTLYKGLSEQDIKNILAPVARLVNVHCQAKNEHERFFRREIERQERYGHDIGWLDGFREKLNSIYNDAVGPFDLGCERIIVDSTADYHPTLKEIADQIGDRNRALRERSIHANKESN